MNDLVTKHYKLECNQCGMPCKKVTVSNHHPWQPIPPSGLKVHHCCHSIFKAPPPQKNADWGDHKDDSHK